jgi:5-methylcytosine-specific restriction endonuclease McrA
VAHPVVAAKVTRVRVYSEEARIRKAAASKASALRHRDDYLARARKQYAANPEKRRLKNRKYRKDNVEKERKRKADYRKSNPEKWRTYLAEWHVANRDKILARRAAYRKDKPDEVRSHNRKRRALKRSVTVESFTAKQLETHLSRFSSGCFYCDGLREEADHFVPLSRGGAHALFNIVPSCRSCNRRKYNQPPEKWLGDRYAQLAAELRSISRNVARPAGLEPAANLIYGQGCSTN